MILHGKGIYNGELVFFSDEGSMKKFCDKRIAVGIMIFIRVVNGAKEVFQSAGHAGKIVILQNRKV